MLKYTQSTKEGDKSMAGVCKVLIKELSKKLTKDFGKGFSTQSLWNMR